MEQVSGNKLAFDYALEETTFTETWKLLKPAFPDGRIFRPRKGGMFSPTVFEIVALSVAFNLDNAKKLTSDQLRDKLQAVVDEAKTDGLTGSGSNSKKKTLGRISKAKEALA
jgi:hypothetical protein